MFEQIETFKRKTLQVVRRFRKDERGVTAMEYGMIAALIGIVATTAIKSIGVEVSEMFDAVKLALQTR